MRLLSSTTRSSDSLQSATFLGKLCRCGWIPVVVISFFCLQVLLIYYLLNHHSFFQQPIDLFQHSSVRQFANSLPDSLEEMVAPQETVAPQSVRTEPEYAIFPVSISTINSTEYIHPKSRKALEYLMGSVVEVDFPDLFFRPTETIQTLLPTIFKELPRSGFHSDFRNPCWYSNQDGTESRLVCLPAAYILGQPKAGTSDLYERLKAHAKVIMPNRKEVRWFTRGEFVRGSMQHEGEDELPQEFMQQLPPHEKLIGKGTSIFSFTSAFHQLANQLVNGREKDLVTIDGGPHTLWWPTQSPDGTFLPQDIPPAQLVRAIQPTARFLVTVADPVRRVYSDYYFLGDDLRPLRPGAAHQKSATQFHERMEEQVRLFESCVSRYMRRLVPRAKKEAPSGLPAAPLLSEHEISLPREYRTYFPLWFRASQMCAHDRHNFARGGWGRLSIGLYSLFLEKWLEHFAPEQFLVVRLEDYEADPRGYMSRIFSFLELEEPSEAAWEHILTNRHFNSHRVAREPLLEQTETLLREFYRPYNELLVVLLRNDSFLWETAGGSLRSQLIAELRQPIHDFHRNPSPDPNPSNGKARRGRHRGRAEEETNQHDLDRVAQPAAPVHDDHAANAHAHQAPDESRERKQLRGAQASGSKLVLRPRQFSLFDLPQPEGNGSRGEDFLQELKDLDLSDSSIAGKMLCKAAFSLDIPLLKYLLHDIGVPEDVMYVQDSKRNAFHCLAGLWTMSEAHSRSHVFAELKGKTTWLSRHLKPPLELQMSSVLSRDIVERLGEDVLKVARWLQRAGVPHSAQDVGGYTPLHHAATGGLIDLVRFLVDIGADVNLLDRSKRSPLHYAAAYGRAEIAAILVGAGASLDQKDAFGVTPRDVIANPGPVSAEDARKFLQIEQRPVRCIPRPIHPEFSPNDSRLGWVGGTGGWGAERLAGFEEDMSCDSVDQFFADEITADEIFHKYLARNAPVLVRGLIDRWPAVDLYSQQKLRETFGSMNVQVSDIPYSQKFGGSRFQEMTLGEYIQEVKDHRLIGGSHPWYVFRGHPIPRLSEAKESLVRHEFCPMPDLIKETFLRASPMAPGEGKEREMFVNAQWALGGEGTGAPIHFHNTAWAALVYGAKKWLIYPPHNMIMSNRQVLDFYETERLDFERRGVKPLTCVQVAGDVMIIPESYGHGVLNIQESIAIATEFKHSVWRIRPPPSILSLVYGFDNRLDKPAQAAAPVGH